MLCHAVIYCTEHYCASSSQSYITWCVVPPLEFQSLYSIQFNSIQFNSIQFNSIQFNSVLFCSDCILSVPSCFTSIPVPSSLDPLSIHIILLCSSVLCTVLISSVLFYSATSFLFILSYSAMHCIDLFCSILLYYIIPFFSLILCDALY